MFQTAGYSGGDQKVRQKAPFMKTKANLLFVALAPWLGVPIIETVQAGLVELAETGNAEPRDTNTFFQIGQLPTLSEDGKVVFYTDLRNNGLLQGWGVFLADGNTVKTVARTSQPSPDLNGNFYTFNSQVALNSASQVFEAGLNGTLGGGADNSAIYQLSGGALTILARAGQTVPGGGATFRSFTGVTPRMNRSGQTAFECATSSSPYVMYRSTGGVLSQIVYFGQPSPDGNGFLQGLLGDPTINNGGKLAFPATLSATSSSNYGLYLADENGLTVLARSGGSAPDGNGKFSSFPSTQLTLNDSNQIAFVANLSSTSAGPADNLGLYRADTRGIVQLVRKSQLVPGGNGRFLDFGGQSHVAINNAGVVAFLADLTGTTGGNADNAAIFLAQGTALTQVARKGQHPPDGNGVLSGFGYPALNNNGEIAFVATLSGTAGGTKDNQGVFFVDSSLAVKQVIRAGQLFSGKTVSSPNFLDGPNYGGLSGLNDHGQLAVWSYLNGNAAVFLWSNSGTPTGLRLFTTAPLGKDVSITFQAVGGTTNFLQAAPSPTGAFVDIGKLVLPGSGLITTNFAESGVATNKTRFYRIRQLR